MLTRAAAMCAGNLIEADDNPHSELRYARKRRLGDSLVIGSRSAVRSLWRPGLVCPAQRCAVLFTCPAAKAALRERQRAKLPP
jgi:hypothetical protein